MWLFSDFDIGGPAGQVNSIFFIFLSKNVLCSLSLLIICSEYIVNALFRGHCFWKGVFDTQSPPSAFSPHYSVTLFNVGSHCTVEDSAPKKHVYVLESQHKAQYIMRVNFGQSTFDFILWQFLRLLSST